MVCMRLRYPNWWSRLFNPWWLTTWLEIGPVTIIQINHRLTQKIGDLCFWHKCFFSQALPLPSSCKSYSLNFCLLLLSLNRLQQKNAGREASLKTQVIDFLNLSRCPVCENIKALQFEELRFGHNSFILSRSSTGNPMKILWPRDSNLRLHVLSLNPLELHNTTRGTSLWTQVLDQSLFLPRSER